MATVENFSEKKSYNKGLIIIAGVLAIVLVGLAALYQYKGKDLIQKAPEQYSVTKNELVSTQIPSGFPEGLPTEANSKVLQNYEATTNDGRLQSTRSVTTTKAAELALKTYTDFFAGKGWKLVPSDSTTNALMLNGSDSLIIEVKEGAANERTITLTLTQSK